MQYLGRIRGSFCTITIVLSFYVWKQDTTLGGYHIPKGSAAMYVSYGVHRDPEVFHQPEEFRPERWSGR